MSNSPISLPAIPLPGLRPDSLGHYLASLGLLRVLARKWPSVSIAWRDGVLYVVAGPATLEELLEHLTAVANQRGWTPYERGWAVEQTRSTKAKSGMPLAVWQADADESHLELFTAHAVPRARVSFNPMLGSGGNAGRRAFSDGWKKAVEALAPPQPKKPGKKETDAKRAAREQADREYAASESERKRTELKALLLGQPVTWMIEKLNAASWFSESNKLYNNGQSAAREGLVSPWAMALACEGLTFWAGSASRRLGARVGPQGAFPFVVKAAAPSVAGEAGRDLAEVWVPIWERPMTLPEVRALYGRGRAEIHGWGAVTPGAFATAIVRRGVDAGISEFVRFSLARTTSTKTFEPRFEGRFLVETSITSKRTSTNLSGALERVLELVNRLPTERKVGQNWRFVGLRGPIEATMVRLAAAPEDPEAACALLDAIITALDRVDRNRSFREMHVSWEPLPIGWLPSVFGDGALGIEARLAIAVVSSFPVQRPFAVYRFGVEPKYSRFEHPERPPVRWVWGPGPLPRVLSRVLLRRTLDWEADKKDGRNEDLVRAFRPVSSADVQRWLDGAVDEALLARWLSRFALFDWRFVPAAVLRFWRTVGPSRNSDASAALCLVGLFQPLFDTRPLRLNGNDDLFREETGARTPGAARALANLMVAGRIDAAVRLAASRYAMANTPLMKSTAPWQVANPERLLAAMLFPLRHYQRVQLVERWVRPQRMKGGVMYG